MPLTREITKLKKKLFGSEGDLRPVVPPFRADSLRPKVHIGCGTVNIEGWINIDARSASHVHIDTDVVDLATFSDASLGEIYTCHMLEHLSFEEVRKILAIFMVKLKPGGTLRIAVPDFSQLARLYVEQGVGLETIKYALMGGQDYAYNFHKSVFDRDTLTRLLQDTGFQQVQSYDTVEDFGTELGDWSTGKISGVPISLNLKACK